MDPKPISRRSACATLSALALLPHQVAAQPTPTIFVSILPQKSFVERIAGDLVRVEVFVPPGASPATHEPTPQQMLTLACALAWFRIGVPFEEAWAPRITANHPRLRVVDTREGITLLPMGASGGRRDPHIWTSPRLVSRQSETIRDALAEMLPEHRARFADNQARFAADLATLDAELRDRFAGLRDRRFMIYHQAWGYFAQDYGPQQIAIEVEGREPGPQSLARIIREAREAGIRVIFVQAQFSTSAAEAVARAIGGEVVRIDPLAEDMITNSRIVAEALTRALR
jgi:zinc transport system substrate-binding protein